MFEIDVNELDREWVGQPELFHTYAIQAADARLALDEAKAQLDITRAEIDKDIRDRPAHYDLEKVTETALLSVLLLQPMHQKAVRAVNKAKHDLDIVQAAVTALDHRKKALENLVFLHGQNYFSTPRVSGDSVAKMKESAKKRTRSRTALSREALED